MIYTIALNLKRFLTDMEGYRPQPAYKGLYDAGITCCTDVVKALEQFQLSPDVARLNKELICAAMDFAQNWETWILQLGPGRFRSATSKTFHEFLLRFFKGCIKAWRIWRIDLEKERRGLL